MKFQILFLFQLFLLIISLTVIAAAAKRFNVIPRLSPIGPRVSRRYHPHQNLAATASISEGFETFFYNQTLDHFNYRPESYATFQQRYVINSKHWGGANSNSSAPILVYFGAEAPLDGDLHFVGFLTENALHFNSLSVYIEHRYYGKSIPFGSREEALKNASTLGYFNSAQALADYAEIILHIKEKLNAKNSPVIVIGGSYGGMLASWFRLKYPHIALGAFASSAPILYFDDITPQDAYYSIVSKDFREVSETCYQTIQKSWAEIDEVASQPNGLSILSSKFKACNTLNDSDELEEYLDRMYCDAAQYNEPSSYPVKRTCEGIDGGDQDDDDDDILGKIFGGVVAYNGNLTCYNISSPSMNSDETTVGWRWQTCSEIVMSVCYGNDSMFPPDHPFDMNTFIKDCKKLYGVSPRPHWVTAYYGGHGIRLILQRFGSNIIFSNGLRDPYSTGGVLENISDTIVAVKTVKGSHCLDILTSLEDDPKWLVAQRKTEIMIIKKWIDKYYADLPTY